MKKTLSIIAGLVLSLGAYTFNFQQGWQLEGAVSDMNLSVFQNVNVVSVWTYDYKNQKWRAYFPNQSIDLGKYGIEPLKQIKKGEGFWVNSVGSFSINVMDKDIQEAYNQGYQDGLNSATSQCSSSDVPPVDDINNSNNGNTLPYNPLDHLIDTPTDFNLSDIAGKTFKIIYEDEENGENTEYPLLTFNNNGIGHVSFSNDDNFTLKYDNGLIDVNSTYGDTLKFKKLAEDNNGIIVVGIDKDENGNYHNKFLDAWLNNINPVDMSTLNYPVTFYSAYDGNMTINGDGTITYPWGEDENYTIQNGQIVTQDQWNNDDNSSDIDIDHMQIVGKVGRYYVLRHEDYWKHWYINPNLKGKTFDDIIDTNQSVNGLFLNSNGTAVVDNNDQQYYSNDENITYSEINSTAINVKECFDSNDCDTYTISIDPNTGKVIRNDEEEIYPEIVSTSPIIKDDVNNTNITGYVTSRKRHMTLKEYYELRLQRAKRRKF